MFVCLGKPGIKDLVAGVVARWCRGLNWKRSHILDDSEGPMYRCMVICHMAYGNLNEKAR